VCRGRRTDESWGWRQWLLSRFKGLAVCLWISRVFPTVGMRVFGLGLGETSGCVVEVVVGGNWKMGSSVACSLDGLVVVEVFGVWPVSRRWKHLWMITKVWKIIPCSSFDFIFIFVFVSGLPSVFLKSEWELLFFFAFCFLFWCVAMWGRRSLRLKISLASFVFCGSYGWYWRRSEILWVSNRVRVNYDAHCGNRNVAS
jgi:hypothetical protein